MAEDPILTAMKKYLRIDHTEDDTFITSLMAAAISYIYQQTGKTKVKTGTDEAGAPVYSNISANELYNLTIKLMVSHWYDNRTFEVKSLGKMEKFSHSIDALISHIATCGDYT